MIPYFLFNSALVRKLILRFMLFYVLEMHLISDIRCHKLFTETMNKSSRDMSQKIMYQRNKCYNKRDMIRLDATKIKRFQSVSKQAMI